eukprot:gene7372-11694_t
MDDITVLNYLEQIILKYGVSNEMSISEMYNKLTDDMKNYLKNKPGKFLKKYPKYFALTTDSGGKVTLKSSIKETKNNKKIHMSEENKLMKGIIENFSQEWILMSLCLVEATKEEKKFIKQCGGVLKFLESHPQIFEIGRGSKDELFAKLKETKVTEEITEKMNEEILLQKIQHLLKDQKGMNIGRLNSLLIDERNYLKLKHGKLTNFLKLNHEYFDVRSEGGGSVALKTKNKMIFGTEKKLKKEEAKIKESKDNSSKSKEPSKQKSESLNPTYIYSIDFELITSHADNYIPIEIGCVKSRLDNGKIVDKFQRFIDIPNNFDSSLASAAHFTQKFIHGLPYRKMKKLAKDSLKQVMNDFLKFIEYNPKDVSILYAKGKKAEINTFEAISTRLNVQFNIKVIDVYELIQYLSDLNEEQAVYVERQASRFLKHEEKCDYHLGIDELFHCGLDDAMANALLIEEGMKNSFKKFLDFEPYSRPSIMGEKRKAEKWEKIMKGKPKVFNLEMINRIKENCSRKWVEIEEIFDWLSLEESRTLVHPYSLPKFLEFYPEIFEVKYDKKSNGHDIFAKLSDSFLEKKSKFKAEEESFEEITLEEEIQSIRIPELKINNDEVMALIEILPKSYMKQFENENIEDLIDIEMDFNRIPKAHFYGNKKIRISDELVSQKDIDYVTCNLSILPNNRSGLEKYLHRISVIRGIVNDIVGITLRVGKPIIGISQAISDILDAKKSILFLGSPGSGKTSFIRDIARYISTNSRTIIVDSSSEISGFGNVPHMSIGDARVMKIPESKNQEKIMIEAIQNHTPDCLIIDEIGTQMEVFATKECSQRGILLYASAHGTVKTLEKNQTVVGLVGGIESVIMSDKNIKSQKDKIQRKLKYKPLFDVIVEFEKESRNKWIIHHNVEILMERLLSGNEYDVEIRTYNKETGAVDIKKEKQKADE